MIVCAAQRQRRGPFRRVRHQLRPLVSRPLVALAKRVAPRVYSLYMRLVWATSRIETGDFERMNALCREHGGLVNLFWHEGVMILGAGYPRAGVKAWGLVSLGDAGDVLARVLEHCGHGVVRGGSSRRSSRRNETVIDDLIELVKGRDDVILGFAVDGTKGPPYRVKRGGLVVARECGCPIVLVRIWTRRHIRIRSWDRFAIPLPFNEIRYSLRGPYAVPSDAGDDAGLERLRVSLEAELADLAACSYRDFGQPVPRALEAVSREHSSM